MSSQEPPSASAAAPSPAGAGAAASSASAAPAAPAAPAPPPPPLPPLPPVPAAGTAAGTPADDAAAAVRWDRARWISVFSSHSPTIREVTESLGLGLSASSSTTNRGIPKFDNPDYRRLSSEVTRLSKELPKERDALLDFAADPHSLDRELEELLTAFGPAIWGRTTDRSCLLTPDPAKKTYQRHLYYEDPDDQRILKTHLHRWIIIKACYYIRNMKLKRFSQASEYDTHNDLEHDDPPSPAKHSLVPSPTTTSAASTPADGLGAADHHSLQGKKRKSFTSLSDGEDPHRMGSPTKRPYQSHTLPLPRKSPRKSLKPFPPDSPVSENMPSLPPLDQTRHASLAPALAPLSNNDLNGAARSNGFTPVNTAAFAAVNNTMTSTRDPASHNAPISNGRNYSSPYDPSAHHGPPVPSSTQKLPKGPPLNTASAGTHSFQAINSPIANGGSAHNSPVVPNPSQPPLLPHQQPQAKAQTSSRSNTPSLHHRSSLAHQRSSRSNTPIAPASLPKVQPAPAPAVQPVSANPSHVQQAIAPRSHHHAVPPIASAPNPAFYAHQPQPVLKSHPMDSAVPAQQPLSTVDFSALQSECLGYLVQYFFPRPGNPPDENVVLHRIETLWHLGAAVFHKQIGPTYDLQSNILNCWITERRKIAQLHSSIASTPGVPLADMVDRLLAMNDLRLMRLKWKNMSSADGLSSEDLLCRTFAVMTNTEGAEYMFKDGLDRVNEAIFEFMRREDMKILIYKR